MNILYILLALGIIGHAINMYCDRILSIFPNGTLKLVNYSKLKEGDYAAKLMEGVSPNVPMRSGVLGVFAIVLEFCAYAALAAGVCVPESPVVRRNSVRGHDVRVHRQLRVSLEVRAGGVHVPQIRAGRACQGHDA